MAIYKGRSVQIVQVSHPVTASITIAHKDGTTSVVSPVELLFTQVELEKISKNHNIITDPKNPNHNPNYKLIDDKEHSEIVDGQDPVKMEAKMKTKAAHPSEVSVPAQTIEVQPKVM